MPELFDKHGGFRRLHSFTLATIVQIETLHFCRRFLTFDHRETGAKFYDPKGRQYDQMTQAARSGRQNIIEGSERSSTSKDTEMKLTDVARASLSELRGDYEIYILDRKQLPWSVHSPEAKAINAISLDDAPFTDDMVHESAKHALEQRKKYARWLDADEAETRAELIDPALKAAGWGVVEGSRIRREYPIAPGRIEGHDRDRQDLHRIPDCLEAVSQPLEPERPADPPSAHPFPRRPQYSGESGVQCLFGFSGRRAGAD